FSVRVSVNEEEGDQMYGVCCVADLLFKAQSVNQVTVIHPRQFVRIDHHSAQSRSGSLSGGT
ncbi:MAG: hypothetical protein AAF655_19150, partial [Bacteroidota bacterium]